VTGGATASRRVLYILAAGRGIGIAGAIVAFTFFSLYLRTRLHVPVAAVGLLVGLLSLGAVVGTFVGGTASDRIGRRPALLITMAFETAMLAILAAVHATLPAAAVGFALGMADGALWPTFGAAVADLLPPRDRPSGFALLTAAVNAGAAIGPGAGGLLLPFGFGRLFLLAATVVALAGAALAVTLPETRQRPHGSDPPTPGRGGYAQVFRDGPMLGLLLTQLPQLVVIGLIIAFLPLAAVATPGVGARLYGLLIAGWGAVIAVLQLPVTRLLGGVRPLHALAAGAALTGLGFVPMSLAPGPWGFAAMVFAVALGETVAGPHMSTLVANLAPVEIRARYQSMIGLNWSVSGVVGPAVGGLVYGSLSYFQFWILAGALAFLPAPLFPLMGRVARIRQAETSIGQRGSAGTA
jgi:predicted MFS family arabinose efflux permease